MAFELGWKDIPGRAHSRGKGLGPCGHLWFRTGPRAAGEEAVGTGVRRLLLLIPKDKETGLVGNKFQVVRTTLPSPRVMGMAPLTDLPACILSPVHPDPPLPQYSLGAAPWALEWFLLPVLLRPPLLLPPCSRRPPCWDTPPQNCQHLPRTFLRPLLRCPLLSASSLTCLFEMSVPRFLLCLIFLHGYFHVVCHIFT